ncbi:MAG: ribonuclease E/G [Lachnospiraceae bacterium]|nr:ribonuclease E/G [Lachnospiraceae bacterium]
MSKLIITKMPFGDKMLQISAIMEENKLLEFRVRNLSYASILGNIYVGKVDRVAVDLKAVFVRISPEQICFLPWKECSSVIYKSPAREGIPKAGDEILVQVNREALKEKLPSATCNLSLPGRFLVLTSGENRCGVSNKLSTEDQKRLKSLIESMRQDTTMGVIARTGAKDASNHQMMEEYGALKEQLQKICDYGISRTCYSCLMQAKSEWQELLEHLPEEKVEEIILDDREEAERLKTILNSFFPSLLPRVRIYDDELLPLPKLYRFEKYLQDALQKKVWLNSGGFLVIEQTEAFVVIDVNTGKSVTRKKAEEAYRKINLEAAVEIARQLRIRQLSGTILIDFINMKNASHQDELLHVLKRAFQKDFSKTIVVDVTALQITEVTRQKSRRSLAEEVRL